MTTDEGLRAALHRKSPRGIRIIATARDIETMNLAVDLGFRPLIKLLQPDERIKIKFAVYQQPVSGKVSVSGDFRGFGDEGSVQVIPFTFYYPYSFPNPFAAYLVPPDLSVNERVFLEDLIEDLVEQSWNQGDTYRLRSCEANWTGSDFAIDYVEQKGPTFVG